MKKYRSHTVLEKFSLDTCYFHQSGNEKQGFWLLSNAQNKKT